jgi:hypothetical protein
VNKNLWEMHNFKLDKRTIKNVAKFPFIIVGVFITLFFLFIEYLHFEWSEIICDKLPKWDT